MSDTATPAPTATETPIPPSPTPTPRPVARRPEAEPFPPDLALRGKAILDTVATRRGTPPLREVEMFLLTREQVRAYANSGSEPRDPAAPRPLDPKNELYRVLGLVPDRPETNVESQSLDNLIALITSFYEASLNAFYMLKELSGGLTGGSATASIAHELVHALQDQYYDLDALRAQRQHDWDGTRALEQLMEGDAIYYEEAYLGYSLRSSYRVPACFRIPQPIRPAVPFVIERELDTWYEDGLCFVRAVLPQLPRGAQDLWENPPTTTEQVLHPEKYLTDEPAKVVTLPSLLPALGEGWNELERSSFGEFSLQNLLLIGLNADRPGVQAAAAGWGGDAWALYTREDARVAQIVTVWDSEADALEFWRALNASLANRGGQVGPVGEGGLNLSVGSAIWRGRIEGDKVSLLVANDAAALERVGGQLGLP